MAVALPDLRGIDLDPGDLGLLWKPGEGFRPIDGIDVYVPGKAPLCPAVIAWKDMAQDRVQVDRACHAAPAQIAAAQVIDWPGDPAPVTTFLPIHDWTATPGHPTTPICCVGTPPAHDPAPHVPPVPLPATGLLIGLALAMLWKATR